MCVLTYFGEGEELFLKLHSRFTLSWSPLLETELFQHSIHAESHSHTARRTEITVMSR